MWTIKTSNNQKIDHTQVNWRNLSSGLLFISSIQFPVKNKKTVYLSGFEKYLYLEEKYCFFNNTGFVDTINVLGKFGDEVYQISYNVRKQHLFQTKNDCEKEFSPLIFNAEKKDWDKGTPRKTNQSLWVKGVPSQPFAKIF